MSIPHVTIFCFEASYALALLLELIYLFRPRGLFRLLVTLSGAAGLLAHTFYLMGAAVVSTAVIANLRETAHEDLK